MPSVPLVFLHIPKTAGSSLNVAIEHALRPASHAFCYDRVLFGTFDDFDSMDASVRQYIHLHHTDVPVAQLLTGHMSLSTIRQRYPAGVQTITVLREPACRLLSHWLFWRGHTDVQLAQWGRWGERVRLARLTLQDFLGARSLACQNDNLAVRMLLWPHTLIPDGDFIDPRHDAVLLAQARRALDGFGFTGVVEDAGLPARLGRWLGRDVSMQALNRTACLPTCLRRPLADELTPAALESLAGLGRLDLQLWLSVARDTLGAGRVEPLRQAALLGNTARFAGLLAGS